MKLARIFQDGMMLQCGRKNLIWGSAETEEKIEVKINDTLVCSTLVKKGDWAFLIPSQKSMTNAKVQIGNITLQNVDFGEVWVAGGQSNMEFALEFCQEWPQVQNEDEDEHLRFYTVGQYSFAEERSLGYKNWHKNWDKWKTYSRENRADFSAVAVFFAKNLRKNGIPVGIVSCNCGSSTASSWLDYRYLAADKDLRSYLDDYDVLRKYLANPEFTAIKDKVRENMYSQASVEAMKGMMKYTLSQKEFLSKIPKMPALPFIDPNVVNPIKAVTWGPKDINAPSALYENMLKEIAGFSVRGVIWYQGESDDEKAEIYGKLFTALIKCWRELWKKRNEEMTDLPFIFAQLAPLGIWGMTSGVKYPVIRKKQEDVSMNVENTFMISTSDVGNVYDIHPKQKEPVGERFALSARKHVYNEDICADSPKAVSAVINEKKIIITFENAKELHIKEKNFESFNGFKFESLANLFAPPITDNLCGLWVNINGIECKDIRCSVQENKLILQSDKFEDKAKISVLFATTPFYEVNLYNEGNLPAFPFSFML
ncbi:MAG: hypothetical protein IJ688_11875 [Treponema sp.]|nr:hypothetical protein [Treponema sp.]